MKNKVFWTHVGSVLFFVIITFVFFLPQFQGKELQQGDQTKWRGMAQEENVYFEKTNNNVAWCGSMFSGMPGYTVNMKHHYSNGLELLRAPFLPFDARTGAIILFALVCGYVLFLSLGCSIPISILGATAFAFSSYFPIIIEAGHVTKGWVMATMPLALAGLFLTIRGKRLLGGVLFAFALTENIRHGHIQITYYLFLLCLFIYLGFVFIKIKEKQAKDIVHPTLIMLLGLVVAVALNSRLLYSNYEMSKTSIRGKSELTSKVDEKQDKSSGLDKDYAFAWSYGKAETMTFLIPNFYGGASGGELGKDSHIAKAYKENHIQAPKSIRTYTYWGDQPFTSGPVYLGAIICFLFVFSLFVVKSKYKWWIVAATVFLTIMSWGKNFDVVNDFLFHYLPFYNKFRTPSMSLVVPQLTFVLLSCMALKTIYDDRTNSESYIRPLTISAGITGGLCLIFWLFPSLLSFSSPMDANLQLPDWYLTALQEDREALLVSDAGRSFLLIALAFVTLYLVLKKKFNKHIGLAISLVAVLSFVDLWTVDRRYLNEDNFVKKSKNNEFVKTKADEFILQDKDPSYRVLTLNNPFNDVNVSYYHKSIGGYNAAKLRRYQDLIELHIEPEMKQIIANLRNISTLAQADSVVTNTNTPVLDMLNMRYLIINDDVPAATNHRADGNAWFVNNVSYVENADEEMLALDRIDPKVQAVVDKRFSDIISAGDYAVDSTSEIKMVSYEPIKVTYTSKSQTDNVALFSEVYYQPGWKAFIDGKQVEHFRANWILRGLEIPAGSHEIEFRHEPDTFWSLVRFCSYASYLFVIVFIGILAVCLFRDKEGNSLLLQKISGLKKK